MQTDKTKRTLRLVKPSPPPANPASMIAAPAVSYYQRIENYAQKIRRTDDVASIINILDEALSETRALNAGHGVPLAPEKLRRAEQEIEALKNELEQLRELVHVDHLTGALNRSGLDNAFAREAARADRSNSPLGVALLDIDDFKSLNDLHGHQAGDAALVHLAQVIRKTVRPSDVVVRFGGEEFLFLLPESGLEQAAKAIQRLQEDLDRRPLVYENRTLPLTFSAGVAVRGREQSCDMVIAHADHALYEAKRAGKRRVITAD
jgi:diguanylate cyclase